MQDLRKAAQQALEALETDPDAMVEVTENHWHYTRDLAFDALRAALAQPEPVMINGLTEAETNASASVIGLTRPKPKPVVWMSPKSQHMIGKNDDTGAAYHIITTSKATGNSTIPLYTAPPQRKPLTNDQIAEICMDCSLVTPSDIYFARAIEKAHGIVDKK